MNPDPKDVEAAVIAIFRDLTVLKEGERLSMLNMERDWPRTHYRRDDLCDALSRLSHDGSLRPSVEPDDLYFILDKKGVGRIADLPRSGDKLLGYLATMNQQAIVRSRHTSASDTSHHRRASDVFQEQDYTG